MIFKIGDKVRVNKSSAINKGRVGTVYDIDNDKLPILVLFDDDCTWLREDQLDPIEEPKEKKTFWIMANKNDVYAYFSKEDALDGLEYDDETLYEVVEVKKYKKGGLIEI